jgi:hypothetical protein
MTNAEKSAAATLQETHEGAITYDTLRDMFKVWRETGNDWHVEAQRIPHRIAKRLGDALSVPKEDVRSGDSSGGPYVDVYKPSSKIANDGEYPRHDRIPNWLEAAELEDDGHWQFKLGLVLEIAPGAFPKTCLLIGGKFLFKSPTTLTLQLLGVGEIFNVDLNADDPFKAVTDRTIKEIAKHLQRTPFDPMPTNSPIGFVDFS